MPGDKTLIRKLVRVAEDPIFGLRYFQAICISQETLAHLNIDPTEYQVVNLTGQRMVNALNVTVVLKE